MYPKGQKRTEHNQYKYINFTPQNVIILNNYSDNAPTSCKLPKVLLNLLSESDDQNFLLNIQKQIELVKDQSLGGVVSGTQVNHSLLKNNESESWEEIDMIDTSGFQRVCDFFFFFKYILMNPKLSGNHDQIYILDSSKCNDSNK